MTKVFTKREETCDDDPNSSMYDGRMQVSARSPSLQGESAIARRERCAWRASAVTYVSARIPTSPFAKLESGRSYLSITIALGALTLHKYIIAHIAY